MTHDEVPNSVWMQGDVNSVMAGHRMVNISHGPAEAWDWPEMVMDFTVAEKVDIDPLKSGQSLHFEVSKTDDLVITDISLESDEQYGKENKAAVDHSNH